MMGAHRPYTMNENVQSVTDGDGTVQQQTLGCLRILEEYFRQMKTLKIYDQSTIFILADHGDMDYEQNPLLMVKKPFSDNEFQISDIRLSYADLPEIFSEAMHGSMDIEGHYEKHGTRYFYIGDDNNNGYTITEYASEGNAYDPESYYKTGRSYSLRMTDIRYTPGTELYFGEDNSATAKPYCVKGVSESSTSFAWTDGKEVEMQFETGLVRDNLIIKFNYVNEFDEIGPQRCYISVNDHLIGSFITEKDEERQMIIPKEFIQDSDTLHLLISLPDAQSPLENGKGQDRRILGLALQRICFEVTEEKYNPEQQFEIEMPNESD